MRLMFQDLRASHKMLALLGKSKSRLDLVLDDLPGIFAILDHDGTILRGNLGLSDLFDSCPEELLGRQFAHLFQPNVWESFQSQILRLAVPGVEKVEFELPVCINGASDIAHFWTVNRFDSRDMPDLRLYSVVGKDISEYKKTLEDFYRVARDLEITKAVQSLLLPRDGRVETPHFKMVSFYRSAEQTGGDWWAYNVRNDGALLVILGDVTGHGAGPAMVTAAIAGSYKTFNQVQTFYNQTYSIPQVFEALDRNLQDIGNGTYWMTMAALEFDPTRKQVFYVSAGAPPAYLMRADGSTEVIAQCSSPLGSGYKKKTPERMDIRSGDRLFLFTDGMFECLNERVQQRLGLSGLYKLFAQTRKMALHEAQCYLVQEVDSMRHQSSPHDDAAFVIVEML